MTAGLLVALTGCQGTTSPAPTAVESTDLTSSDGGFDQHAVVGVVLRADSGALGDRLSDGLSAAGFHPEVRTARSDDAAASQRQALRALVRAGAKAVLVEAEEPAALRAEVQYAHDAGVVVVALADPLPGADEPGDGGVAADYRVDGDGSEATLVERAVDTVGSLQRGEKPTGG